MKSDQLWRIGAIAGFAAVALGAFGAHGLKGFLEQNGTTDYWRTGSTYHLVHALAILLAAIGSRRGAAWAFLAGIILFSGSLYLLAVTNARWLGMITPLGGVCFLAGWLMLCRRPRGSGNSGAIG